MKQKVIKYILLATLIFSLTGCAPTTQVMVNVENSKNISNRVIGLDAMVEIGNSLYYDSATKIVYLWDGYSGMANCATTPSPYYAPNGLPYKYNSDTNTFEEIGGIQ
jgi:hypothetical protein